MENISRARIGPVAQQVPRADRADDHRRRQIGRRHGVGEAVGEGRVEDHRRPALRHEPAVGIERVARGRLHPGIGGQYPEGREQRAARDEAGRQEVQAGAHPLHPEQHHPEEARLQEEGGQHLIAEQRPEHGSGLVREDRPVGAELVAHHQPRHDAHGEGYGEDLQPVAVGVEIDWLVGGEPEGFQHREIARQPDGESREQEVPDDREGELTAGEVERAREMVGQHPWALPLAGMGTSGRPAMDRTEPSMPPECRPAFICHSSGVSIQVYDAKTYSI